MLEKLVFVLTIAMVGQFILGTTACLHNGNIACSSLSRSEIVVPVFAPSGEVSAVLDIDSEHLATFDVTDKEWLERIVATLYE